MLEFLEWSHPGALWLLTLPVVLLLLTRLNSKPPIRATGTLHIWKEIVASGSSQGRRSLNRIPLSTWLLATALMAGALGASDPRLIEPARANRVTCVVDTSPSMYLPLGDSTRIEHSERLALNWLAEQTGWESDLLWIRFVQGVREEVLSEHLPPAWRVAPEGAESEPRWSDFDQPGVLWLTDRASTQPSVAAVLIASGGEAVPGPVGVQGTARFDWDGESVVRVEDAAPKGVLSWTAKDEARLAVEVLEFAQVWALERGFQVLVGAAEARLRLRAPAGEGDPVRLGRDGWSFDGAATALAPGEGEVWLRRGTSNYVRFRPGWLECGLSRTEKLGGDPAAFAVSWGELFDRAVLPAKGVVPLMERRGAGPPLVRAGAQVARPAKVKPLSRGVQPGAWLATAAFFLALAASLLGQRS